MVTKQFYSRKELDIYFGLGRNTIIRREEEMKKLIPKIYPPEAFILDSATPRIHKGAFQHFLNNRTAINNGQKVKPYVVRDI